MAGNKVLSTVSLAIAADTAKYETSLAKAKQETVKNVTAMGSSMAGLKQTAVKEFGAAAKATEQLTDKSKATAKALKEQAAAAKANLKEVSQAHKEAAKEAAEEAKAVKKAAAEERKAIKEVIEELKHRTEAESKAAADSKRYAEQMAKAFKGSSDQITASTRTLSTSLGGLKAGFAGLAAGVAATFTISTAKHLLDTASTFNTLNQRVKTATKETGDYAVVQERLYKMAIKNGAQMSDTVQVFQGLARSAKELGASNSQMLTLTNTMQQLGVISGASASNMSAGLQQFSQAMAGGVVHAEEWNSIVENIPEVAQRIAKGLGLSIGQTRQLMLDGKLLSKDVFDVLLKQSDQISKEFAGMPRSMQQAYAGMETQFGKTLSKIDQITGATKGAVTAIDWVTAALERMNKEVERPVGLDGKKTDNGPLTVRGIKTDNKHMNTAGMAGFGRKIRDQISNLGDLANPSLTPGQLRYNAIRREQLRQELMDNELRLGPDAPPPPKAGSSASSPTPAKENKKHTADVNRANDLIASMKAQNAELEAKLRHDDEAITKEKALLKLSKDRTLTDSERNKYAKEINALAARHAELIRTEAIQKEKEKLGEILAGHKEKIALLKNELNDQTEGNALLEANKQIQAAVKVGKVETLAAQREILAAAKEEAILRDAVKLKSIEESYKQQLESTKAKNDHAKELIPILEAEKKIRDAITAGMSQNVAAQERIRNLAKEIADEQLAKSFEAEQAKLDKIGESMADENEKLALKLKGQENLAKYLDGERDVRKQIAEYAKEEAEHIKAIQDSQLSEPDKADRVQKVKDGYSKLTGSANSKIDDIRQQANENTRLNQALTEQEQILQNIKDSTGSYKSKLAELDAQYLKGNITQKQWQKTAEELWKSQTKSAHTVGDAIKQMGQSMTTAIMNGTKLTDVFKNMGKSLAALAAQKFVFEPIANAIDNWSSKLFGTGKYTAKPSMPGAGGSLASGSQTGSMLGNALGGAYGGGNLTSSSPAQQALDIAQMMGLPKFANGGYFDGGPMLVGERGPEIMWPQSGGYVQNNRDAMSMFGGWAGGGGDALSSLGAWRQKAQDAMVSGRPLSYFDLQEGNAREADRFRRELDWSNTDEVDYAKVLDGIVKAKARAQNEKDRMDGGGGVNFNWRAVANNLQEQDGLGFTRATEAGGRTTFADGNQQRAHLQEAAALGINVPASLWRKAGMLADAYDQQDSISGGTVQSRSFYNVMGTYGGSGYKSMGMSGNNLDNSVADIWDKNSGANGAERMDAMGGKDYMWNKFHPNGNGYEGVKDMWGYTHSAAHNQGRDFVGWDGKGDKGHRGGYLNEYRPQDSWVNANGDRLTIGKDGWVTGPDGHYTKGGSRYYGDDQLEYLNPDLAAKMQRQRREAYDMTHPPISQSNGPPPRSGYQDMLDSGAYSPVSNSDMMNGLDNLRNRSTRNGDDFSDILNAKQDAKAAKDELKRIKEDAKLEARNIKKYGPDWRQQAGDYSRSNGPLGNTALDSKGYGSLSPEGGSANNDAAMADEQWMKEFGSTMDLGYSKGYKRIQQEQLKKITSSVYGIPNGGAVGAPGHLSASSGDVFDNYGTAYSGSGRMTDSQRLNTPFRNFADGFDDGHFGAQAGGDTGASAPRGGWQIKAYQQGGKQIRAYAKGGDIRGGELALVGEKGPELIVPKSDGRVIPNDQLLDRRNDGRPVIKFINNTGVSIAEPVYEPQPDGSIGLILNAMAANGANNGVTARGVKQAGRSTPR